MSLPAPPHTTAARIRVIVVGYNTKRYWPRQRMALEAQSCTDWDLVIVDNASPPHERLNAADLPPGARLIQLEDNIGFAAANNLAARDTDAAFLAFLNPDAFPEPDWLEALLAAAARWPDAAAFGSTQVYNDNPALLDGAGDEMLWCGFPYRSLFRKPRRRDRPEGLVFSACAAAAFYRAEHFRAAGGFDERFFCYNEDVDLGYRLRLRGRMSVQASKALVHHVGGGASSAAKSRSSAFADYHGARNRLWTFVKTTPPLLFWLTAPAHALLTLIVLAAHAASGRGGASWRGIRDGLKGLPAIWRARRDVQASRTVSSLSIARAMIWSPVAALSRAPKRKPGA